MLQLSYTGMLQTVQIRRDGYAFRPLIPDFICTYKPLILHSDVPIDGETCKQILRKANLTNWHIGYMLHWLFFPNSSKCVDHTS